MTTAQIQAIETQIEAARKRGDGREVGRLRFELPFEERQRIFGEWATAKGRGMPLARPTLVKGHESAGPTYSRLVRDDGPTPVVAISKRAFEKIKSPRVGLEDGGWLVGPKHRDGRVIQAMDSVFQPVEDDRDSTSLLVHFDEIDQIDEGRKPECVVAHWHSQPSSSDPSPQDIKMWAGAFEHSGRAAFAGLVLRERLTGAVDIQAFVFSKENGETVHRKATIYVRS